MRKIIRGDVRLDGLYLTELLDLSDVEVIGDFYCDNNNLTSLEGAPQIVGGDFDCSYNNLTSLEGAPKTVGGDFTCWYNNLTNLFGAPQIINDSFDCSFNNLTSLEGIPKSIGYGDGDPFDAIGNFWISKELKDRFPKEYIRSLSDIRGTIVYY